VVRASGALVALGGLSWTGLHVQPAPFPAAPQALASSESIPLPAGLPEPVEHFYRQTYGQRVPVIKTAVITGRGTIRLFGVNFPARFRFTHETRHIFRSYIELTAFNLPLMKVNEYYVNGHTRMETPGGIQERSPRLDQGGNIRLWAERATWLPAMLLTDPQVRWEPIDAVTALLVVPFGEEQERLVVRFDSATGKLQYVEAMRYKGADAIAKTLWISGVWFGERPWAIWNVEDVVYNSPVDTSLTAKGP